MKKVLLATALAAVSLTATEANWGGFYLRGALAVNGAGVTNKKDGKAVDGDKFELNKNLEIAGGWGMTVANAVYLGVDAQLGNFGIIYNASDVEGSKSSTRFTWAPNLQARIGVPLRVALPYVAGGLGYNKIVSETDVTTLPEGNLTWAVRVGSDFKVTDNFFVGLYGQFVRTFAEKKDTEKTETASSATSVGFTFGWQF
jgi:opacity protein-like surface antigen